MAACVREMVKHTQREDEIKVSVWKWQSFRRALHERDIGSPYILLGNAQSLGACIRGHKVSNERASSQAGLPKKYGARLVSQGMLGA